MNINVLIALEAGKRLGFVVLMGIIAVVFAGLPAAWNGPIAFFVFGLAGSALIVLATVPLGHTELGADLRGIAGLLIVIQLVFLCSLWWAPAKIFNWMVSYYKQIDFGIWAMLLARQLWVVRRGHRFLSWPAFDWVRFVFGETTDHSELSSSEKFWGYGSMIGGFLVGFLLCGHVTYLAVVFLVAPALFLMVSARNAQFEIVD